MRFGPLSILVLLSACAPVVPVTVVLDEAACVGEDAALALVVEDGPCSATLSSARHASLDEGLREPLSPGTYCIDAVAYRHEPDTRTCMLLALGRENRRLPTDRAPVELAPSCDPVPDELGDALLFEVAGCNGRCDATRCICTGACDLAGTLPCPPPTEVERLAMGDHYVCGLAGDRRSFHCWGDEAMGTAIDGRAAVETGVALGFPQSGEDAYVAFAGAPDRLCRRSSSGPFECGPDWRVALLDTVPRLAAAGTDFLCTADRDVRCRTRAGANVTLNDDFPVQLDAGSEQVCALTNGEIRCMAPLGPACVGATCPFILPRPVIIDGVPFVPSWFAMDVGWSRVCAVDGGRRLSCWSTGATDAIGLPAPEAIGTRVRELRTEHLAVPTLIADPSADRPGVIEVAVGSQHVCVRRADEQVVCGVIERLDDGFALMRTETFPGAGPVRGFAAGAQGISCAIRAVAGAPSRVECFQLAGFGEGSALLGRAHTRDLEPERVDADRGDLAVCP